MKITIVLAIVAALVALRLIKANLLTWTLSIWVAFYVAVRFGFIVPGFNPGMPVINKPPIGLTDQEILAVIAYLQSNGGKVTVNLQSKVWPLGSDASAGAATAEPKAKE